jgi:hypothetical protein
MSVLGSKNASTLKLESLWKKICSASMCFWKQIYVPPWELKTLYHFIFYSTCCFMFFNFAFNEFTCCFYNLTACILGKLVICAYHYVPFHIFVLSSKCFQTLLFGNLCFLFSFDDLNHCYLHGRTVN